MKDFVPDEGPDGPPAITDRDTVLRREPGARGRLATHREPLADRYAVPANGVEIPGVPTAALDHFPPGTILRRWLYQDGIGRKHRLEDVTAGGRRKA